MFWQFDGKRYPVVWIEQLSARDIMTLQVQLVDAEFTTLRTADEVRDKLNQIWSRPKPEWEEEPELFFCMVVQLWAAMRAAGERVSILDMVDMPRDVYDALELVKQPGDEAGEGEGKANPPSGSGGVKQPRKKPRRGR